MKEILLYTPFWGWAAAEFISELEASKNNDIVIRLNTPGGDVEAAFGMVAKMAERTKSTKVKVDGKAHSMGAFFLAYADNVEALDVSEIMIHRAAYASYIEQDMEMFTQDMKDSLQRTNDKLKEALLAKIDTSKFIAITGKTIDEIFDMSQRVEVTLTAAQAQEVGLVDNVVTITPQKRAELRGYYAKAAMSGVPIEPLAALKEAETPKQAKQKQEQTIKNKAMTAAEFKSSNPQAYAEIFNAGVSAERDRVGEYMAYADVDLEACRTGIKSGENMSRTMAAEMSRKAMSAEFLKSSEDGSPEAVVTQEPKPEKSAEDKQIEAALAEARELAKK